MGYRIHTATKYEVKYGSGSYFNWASNYINRIIEALGEGEVFYNDEYDICNASEIEASREKLTQNLDKIITPNPDWDYHEDLEEVIRDMEQDKECGITRDYLHSSLKTLISDADPNNDMIHFAWF